MSDVLQKIKAFKRLENTSCVPVTNTDISDLNVYQYRTDTDFKKSSQYTFTTFLFLYPGKHLFQQKNLQSSVLIIISYEVLDEKYQ